MCNIVAVATKPHNHDQVNRTKQPSDIPFAEPLLLHLSLPIAHSTSHLLFSYVPENAILKFFIFKQNLFDGVCVYKRIDGWIVHYARVGYFVSVWAVKGFVLWSF